MHSIPETSILLIMGQLFHVHFVFAFTAALPFKNCCFSWSLMLQKQRGDWSHMSITLQKKTLFFIRFDVAQTKTGRCMFWVACFASLRTSILTSLVIVNHTWYSKCIPSQQIQWFAAFFLHDQFVVSSPLLIWWLSHSIQYRCIAKGFFLESTRLVGVCYELLVWLIYAVVFQ